MISHVVSYQYLQPFLKILETLYCDATVTVCLFLSHYMRQILEALRYCHDNNVIHRDVKVFVTHNYCPRLTAALLS